MKRERMKGERNEIKSTDEKFAMRIQLIMLMLRTKPRLTRQQICLIVRYAIQCLQVGVFPLPFRQDLHHVVFQE